MELARMSACMNTRIKENAKTRKQNSNSKGPWLVRLPVDAADQHFTLKFTVLGDTYPQKHIVKSKFLGINTCLLDRH